LVLTNLRDLAADDVVRRLDASGTSVRRINADTCATSAIPTWNLDEDEAGDIGAVWWRQFEIPADGSPFGTDIDELLVVRAQWRAWLTTLAELDIPWINDLWAARKAEDKIIQLRTARSLGFAVPKTIITNDRAAAARFGQDEATVIKTLAAAYFEATEKGFVYTNPLSAGLTSPEAAWHAQPVLVQRRVSGTDVRVVALGQECFGASCETDALDWRTAGEAATWHPWDVPAGVAERCLRYLSDMGLRYAAFDFVLDGDILWFLEANQAGEWVFIDRPLKLGIAESLAVMLGDLAGGST
jgi:glutathione synthase/RimK-type ligase-like ATP-grasp enzyme